MTITANATAIVYGDSTIQTTAGGSGKRLAYVYTANNTYTKPSDLKYIKIIIKGAGGGGGGAIPTANSSGGHGGTGATLTIWSNAPQLPASAMPIVVGIGGAGGAASAPGSAGSNSSLTISSSLLAAGAGGGGLVGTPYASGGGATGSPGFPYFFPGLVYTDTVVGNTPVYTLAIGQPGFAAMGYGEYGLYGPATGGPGSVGLGYGSGGGGGTAGPTGVGAGQSGSPGFVYIEEYY